MANFHFTNFTEFSFVIWNKYNQKIPRLSPLIVVKGKEQNRKQIIFSKHINNDYQFCLQGVTVRLKPVERN